MWQNYLISLLIKKSLTAKINSKLSFMSDFKQRVIVSFFCVAIEQDHMGCRLNPASHKIHAGADFWQPNEMKTENGRIC